MYISRKIETTLRDWQKSTDFKPILLRGARQVGKTSVVRHFGKSFTSFVEINFEESPEFKTLFESNLSIESICEQIEILTGITLNDGKTLLFIDEIQACPDAIKALRFFYEKRPNLHVIAAGSLLEFALAELPSFGVGRIRSIFVYPLSFEEFLSALGEDKLRDYLGKANFDQAISEPIHAKLQQVHKTFLLIGGMPEAVKAYARGKSLLEIQRVLDDLVISIQADFDKYKARFPAVRLIEVFNTVAAQTGNKFTYSYSGASLNYPQIKEALQLLQLAGLIYPVSHSASNGIPLGAEVNPKKTKMLLFDTGIYQRTLGLNLGELILEQDVTLVNKGSIAELCVGIELIKNQDPYNKQYLYYWQREAKNSQAEVDYVLQLGSKIIPIEVKSGTKGRMQSLYSFIDEKKSAFGLRISSENFSVLEKVKILPVYATHLIYKIC
jgi:uncharacterized protein